MCVHLSHMQWMLYHNECKMIDAYWIKTCDLYWIVLNCTRILKITFILEYAADGVADCSKRRYMHTKSTV